MYTFIEEQYDNSCINERIKNKIPQVNASKTAFDFFKKHSNPSPGKLMK